MIAQLLFLRLQIRNHRLSQSPALWRKFYVHGNIAAHESVGVFDLRQKLLCTNINGRIHINDHATNINTFLSWRIGSPQCL